METKKENKKAETVLTYADKYEKIGSMKKKAIAEERKELIPRYCSSGKLSDTELNLLRILLKGGAIGRDDRVGDARKFPKCFTILNGRIKGSIQERGLDHLVDESDLTKYGLIVSTKDSVTQWSLPNNSDKKDFIRRIIALHV